ncbi:alpha-2-macroglobulin family protein [Frigoriglobus tundricola]|uniref:Alpha-2-macroglobulin domain-containing protein n=1 Tax=Frigoriglobus tundricola TaxID=2774151 RepID=A0A6M5Z2K2_9BACT|nr:alpha-2-macroglobulin family protein [Frigoriglobus tundricola]QJX00640.1 hypothetical protein FTUN_8272 [Frigoriglobus tundricola]
MTPASPVITELQPLLDALAEENITPDQLRRLEELVLMHPEAEAHYIRFMSFCADLIGHVAGLPEPKQVATTALPPIAPTQDPPHPRLEPARPSPVAPRADRRTSRARKLIAWLLVAGTVSSVIGSQLYTWRERARTVRDAEVAVATAQRELARVKAAQDAALEESRKPVEAALVAERELLERYRAAQTSARKAIEEKDFVVRLTGPEHVQPGAPNKWQIETLRHGAIGRPQKLDVVVKDAKDTELLRQTHEKPVGAATLELTAAFWEKVKPGSDLFLEVVAHTEDRKSVLAERLPLARPVYVTHLVTDKPLYKPGETVRFRSLTLDRSSLRPPEHDLHLIFKLRDPSDTVVPLDEGNGRLLRALQPVVDANRKHIRGIGVGEYALSADAPGGEYKLDLFEKLAGTGKEVLLETRKFIVNRYVPDTFEKKLEFDGKSYGPGETVQARIEVSRTAGGPMKNAKATVVASTVRTILYEQKDAKFTTLTSGGVTKTFLNVRFVLPPSIFEKAPSNAPPSATLSVNIQDGSDTEAIVRPIPLVSKTLGIGFFPEGGEMIAGVPGRVYFMVRMPIVGGSKPADLKGYITDGTNTITEVSTLTDAENPGVNRGHGAFTLTPKAGTKYFLKLLTPIGITEPTRDGFPLPVAKADGVALTALDAVTERGGAIRVRLQTAQGPKTLHVGAYVRERLVAQQKVELEANKPVEVSLKGDEPAGGVTRVTVFEERKGDAPDLTALTPRAERLVFRGSAEHLVLKANPDKTRYSPSDRVRLDLSAVTESGAPTPAVLLVGVVNRSVITMADNKNDRLLPTHFLLSGEVKNSAELEHADFLLTDHPKAGVALDLLLGTQGWRRFAEQDIAPSNPTDRPDVDKMLVAHGQRPTAPLELFKLEEQRLRAEFQPQLEQARLRSAAKEAQWNAIPAARLAQMMNVQTAVSVATAQVRDAREALDDFEERYEQLVPSLPSLLAFLAVLGTLTLLFMVMREATATKPAGKGRPYIAGAGALIVCGLLAVTMKNMGTNANSTFSFVGSSIKPPGSRSRGAVDERPDMAVAGSIRNEGIDRSGSMPAPTEPPSFPRVPSGPPAAPPKAPTRNVEGKSVANGLPGNTKDARSNRSAPSVSNRSDLGAEKTRVASAFNPNQIPEALKGHGLARGMYSTIESLTAPFVVREYAHQRDPALGEVRSDFTETVYWHPVLVMPATGQATVEFQLSDDIARYQVLVAGHTTDGRIGAITTTIEARKPFSIDPKLPLEIAHTDTIDAPIRVTNDSNVRRNVAFTATPNGLKTTGLLQDVIDLEPNGKGRKILRLNADKLEGEASLSIEGTSIPAEKDAIFRTIRIVPDGFPGVGSFSDMLENGRARGGITLPKDVVPGSLQVRLEVYPTSMADLVKGLDGLLREPSGCFEQTSTTNYPNTLILDYMNQTNQVNPGAAKRAKELLARGYGRLTSFECPDTPLATRQGFEWFGAADRQHEALTAYGLLQFKDMSRVHPVDPQLIKRTQGFLLSRKDGTGGFKRNARALDGFGGAPKHTTDVYIVWALVESDPDDTERLDLKTEIASLKAEALNANSVGGRDAYFVALVANVVLQRGDRETAHKLLDRLKDKHVKAGAVTGAVTSITRSGGRDLEIETTALALLGWLRANDPSYALTIKAATKWISQQRGGYGGFGSTQSTIMALKALTLFAKKAAHPAEAGELRVLVGGKVAGTRRFSEQDVEVIGLDIPNPDAVFAPGRSEVEIVTDAKQPYPFALAYTYTTLTPVSAEKCAVKIGTKLGKTEAAEGDTVPLHLTFENKQNKGQGMAVAVVGIPAGMRVPTDMKQLTDLREKGQVAYFETRGRELVLYWRELAPEQKIALTVDLVCDVPGTYHGPASRGYLYYDADHKHWVEPLAVKIAPLAAEPAQAQGP